MSLPHSGAGALRPPDLARHGAPLGARGAGSWKRADSPCGTSSRRRRRAQRDGRACGVRRLHQPDPALSGHRPSRRTARGPRSTTGRASTARCRGWSMRCPTARRASHRAGLPGRRRARSDAAPAARRPAGDRTRSPSAARRWATTLDWWEQSERRAQLAPACCANATALIPTTSSWTRTARARRGLTSTVTFPQGQSGARRLGHQEHGHRSERRGCRRRLPEDRAGARLPHREGGDRGDQEHGGDPSRATCSC